MPSESLGTQEAGGTAGKQLQDAPEQQGKGLDKTDSSPFAGALKVVAYEGQNSCRRLTGSCSRYSEIGNSGSSSKESGEKNVAPSTAQGKRNTSEGPM